MNQMDLFDDELTEKEVKEPDVVAIRSDRVGPIHFGSTAASFTLIRDVLADLVAPAAEDEPSS